MHHLFVALIPKPIRDRVENTISKTRLNQNSRGIRRVVGSRKAEASFNSLGSSSREGDFSRLVERNDSDQLGTRGRADLGPSLKRTGSDGLTQMDVEDQAGRGLEGSNLPPDDLRKLQSGQGIVVKTEIITEEERIEKILGI